MPGAQCVLLAGVLSQCCESDRLWLWWLPRVHALEAAGAGAAAHPCAFSEQLPCCSACGRQAGAEACPATEAAAGETAVCEREQAGA